MSPTPTPHDVGFFMSPAELRAWLDANHGTAPELWVGMRPKAAGLPTVSWEDIVDEVLCVGWIDGVRYRVEGGSCIRITPRRPGSVWSARNIGRVAALTAEGRMRPAGVAAFEARRADRSGVYAYETGANGFSPELERRFRDAADAWAFFEQQPPGYRRLATGWVMGAKREETRDKRIGQLIEDSAAGRRLGAITSPSRRDAG